MSLQSKILGSRTQKPCVRECFFACCKNALLVIAKESAAHPKSGILGAELPYTWRATSKCAEGPAQLVAATAVGHKQVC